MKKIDVHIHSSMWKKTQLQPHCVLASPEELRESYDGLGIEKGIFMPLISPEYRFSVQTNEEAEYLSHKYPDLFWWCCNIDPRMGENNAKTDFSYFLNYYKERGALGVGELTTNIYTDDPLLDNFFHHCAMCDMPVTIHIAHKKYDTYGIIDDLHLPRLEKMLKKYPDLKIIGHSMCFWSEIDGAVTDAERSGYPTGKVREGRVSELMRHYPNLYCDLSAGSGFNALSRDPDFAYRFIEEFSDRLMFATDICAPHQEAPLSAWLDDAEKNGLISYNNYAKICRENAIRIFKISEEEK
ncbi:MAG: amidohydrolase family protein [Oscillospiraceae bacterium]|nr:amidohydrolase family protein [Oscillospiraceae bacterium]